MLDLCDQNVQNAIHVVYNLLRLTNVVAICYFIHAAKWKRNPMRKIPQTFGALHRLVAKWTCFFNNTPCKMFCKLP